MIRRASPGECLVCGKAHSACTPEDKTTAITVPQLPARDRRSSVEVQSFSTKTYRRGKKVE